MKLVQKKRTKKTLKDHSKLSKITFALISRKTVKTPCVQQTTLNNHSRKSLNNHSKITPRIFIFFYFVLFRRRFALFLKISGRFFSVLFRFAFQKFQFSRFSGATVDFFGDFEGVTSICQRVFRFFSVLQSILRFFLATEAISCDFLAGIYQLAPMGS